MFQLPIIKILLCLIFLLISLLPSIAQQEIDKSNLTQQKPRLQHASKYQNDVNVNDYWISEKLDGVRGFWTGKQLLTRSGNDLSPPKWFIENWPNIAIGGELWSARGQFEQISACVRRKNSDGKCWQDLKLMIFDLPKHAGDFTQRIVAMQQLVAQHHSPYLGMVHQQRVKYNMELYKLLDNVVEKKGEGLMLHMANAHYQYGRSKNLLKLKKYQDAEAIVMAHTLGKGKYKGMLGALKVQTPEGVIFKIGSGFTDQQRRQPPIIGSTISYKYIGKTQRGVPRFASFLRIKNEH